MALPGKRHPRSLGRHRRSAWMARLKASKLQACPKCKTPKQPHQVCKVCGTYKGATVLKTKHRVTRSERRAAEKAALARSKAAAAEATHTHEEE
ncbi:MAG: 50S ribosomal protein L32 [Candidatus Andersenbacteria bacterium]